MSVRPLAFAALIAILLFWGVCMWYMHTRAEVLQALETQDAYVVLTQGRGLLVRGSPAPLSVGVPETLEEGDIVRTLGDSLATIAWPDGSVSRIDQNSVVRIDTLEYQPETSFFDIFFILEKGASWTNVTSYLRGESQFRQGIGGKDVVASVRGTVFAVDVEDEYVYTASHAVELANAEGAVSLIPQGSAMDFLSFQQVYDSVLDDQWKTLNEQADLEYINEKIQATKSRLEAVYGSNSVIDGIYDFIDRVFVAAGIVKERTIAGEYDPVALVRDVGEIVIDGDIEALADWYNDTIGRFNITDNEISDEYYQALLNLYEELHFIDETPEQLAAKGALREMVVETAPEEEQAELSTDFAQFSLYDALSAEELGDSEVAQMLATDMTQFLWSEEDYTLIRKYYEGLSDEDLEQFNTVMNSVRLGGEEILQVLQSESLSEQILQNLGENRQQILESLDRRIGEALDELRDRNLKDEITNTAEDVINELWEESLLDTIKNTISK